MTKKKTISYKQDFVKRGQGIVSSLVETAISKIPFGTVVNRAIDVLPFELHIPGYNYCGPGTKLQQRLARGDAGINKLDEACKEHDITYSKYSDSERRSIADRALAEKAWQRVKSSDSSLGEKAAALTVAAGMRAKRAVGGGKKRRKPRKVGGGGGERKKPAKRCNCKKTGKGQGKKKGRGLRLGPYRRVY